MLQKQDGLIARAVSDSGLSTDQEEALGGSVVLREVPDHLHHQDILQFHSTLHQHFQTIT